MFFNSIDFAVFFPIVFTIYWLLSKNLTLRNVFILIASYFFYGCWNWKFLMLIITSSIVDYIIGRYIMKSTSKSKKKVLLIVSLMVNLGILFYFKYFEFFVSSFADSFSLFGRAFDTDTLNIILPVGISFYTFQTLSYTIDIYRGKLKASTDPIAFFTFVAFFPQLVAGPIERASHLLPQFSQRHHFNYDQVKSGLLLMAFGLFKKMVIADRAAILVNQVYNSPDDYYGVQVIIATILFAFQIYCDFSGYSDIAIGASRTLGFDLMKNFNTPYFSKSITEFWRRWHISLSTWFRDYVYIPLGGSRNGQFVMYRNLFLVFVISGLWHGAAWTFVIWGAIHGTVIVIEKALSKSRNKIKNQLQLKNSQPSGKLFYIFITFSIVCFAWIFFRANSIGDALLLVSKISLDNFSIVFTDELFNLGLSRSQFLILITAILLLIYFEIRLKKVKILNQLSSQPLIYRWACYLCIACTITLFGIYGLDSSSQFIYFQF